MTNPAIQLRPYRRADLPALRAAIVESRDDVAPWLPDLLGGLEAASLERWFEMQAGDRLTGAALHCAIVSEADAVLGGCGLTNLNRRHLFANLYYWVRSNATGQGIASSAARQLARLGFETLGLQRVEIVVDCLNAPSLRAAEKAGAHREGVLRNRLRTGEQSFDAVMFSLVPGDFG